jgi:Sec-independent protein translocase protein TatA
MQAIAASVSMLAVFNMGPWEVFLVLALVVILFGRGGKLSELGRGLWLGIAKFRDALDDASKDAGRSVGGIFGKGAAQALTPDNYVAELYDPAAFHRESKPPKRRKGVFMVFSMLWRWILLRVGKAG